MSDRNTFSAGLGAKVVGAIADADGTPAEANSLAENPELVRRLLAVLRGQAEIVMKKLYNLRRLFEDKKFMLPETDGKEILGKASDVFVYIDSDFRNYDCNVTGQPTKETEVAVYEMVKDGSFADIFGGFGADLDRLCLTQTQIKKFVQDHRDALRTEGYATFFLFKEHNEFFVARVRLDSGGALMVDVYRFSYDGVWLAGRRHRIVVPQLTA